MDLTVLCFIAVAIHFGHLLLSEFFAILNVRSVYFKRYRYPSDSRKGN